MAFNFNGNTPKKILYNGLNVAKLIYNGVVVWMSKVLATVSGILPLTLTNSTGDDLVDYKLYGNSEYEGLPDGYTQVEYLESTGTQYIDTRYYPNNLTDVECKFMYNQFTGNTASSVFGVRVSSNSVQQFLMSVFNGVLWIVNGLNDRSIDNVSPVVNTEYILRIAPNGAYWNGTEIFTMTFSVANCPDYSMFMFGRHTRSGLANKFYGKIYYLKIYEAGVLTRNFIPCKNPSNVAGMYDTVNGVFYTNAGTGTFNIGSVVSKKSVGDLVTDTSDTNYGKYKIPVLTNSNTTNIYLNKPLRKISKLPTGYTEIEHIRSTGTQYINTGLPSSQNVYEFITEVGGTSNTSTNQGVLFGAPYGFNVSIVSKIYRATGQCITNKMISENTYDTLHLITNPAQSSIKLTINDTEFTGTYSSYQYNNDLGIFGYVNRTQLVSCKIKYLQIKKDGVLVRNFIPCKNPSNVVGMYDTVNDVFYSNAGTGSFIAGAEVETVYYTDYLDYENQKVVRNVDDNDKGLDTPVEESVVLSAVPTDEGTTVFDVDTDVTPSYAEVKYYKNGS